jgi:hypothetical protein
VQNGLPTDGLNLGTVPLEARTVTAPGSESQQARDNRAHDEGLIPTGLNKRFALNEWQPLTGLR